MLFKPEMDETDRKIALFLQDNLPLVHSPFRECAGALGINETEVVERMGRLRSTGAITRLGPFFNATRMGGDFCLCAMQVPEECWRETVERVNAFLEVAHNYRRDHDLNMWFVLAVEQAEKVGEVADRIEAATGLVVYRFPKLREFFLEMKVSA